MKASGEKQFLYSIRLPRLRAVAAFLLLFYVLADVSVIEYLSGNAALGIPSYNKVVDSDSTAPLAESRADSVQSRPNEFYLKGIYKSESSTDEDDCFLCCTHIILGYDSILAVIAAPLPLTARKTSAVFYYRQKHSDSHLPPFYRPPRLA